jgi:hypothetical protein
MVSFGNQYRSGGTWWSRRRAWWSRRSNAQRYLIVGSAAALVIWLAWPYIKGATGRNAHQQRYAYGDAPRTVDRYGLLPRGDDGYAEGPRRGWRPRGEGDYAERPGHAPVPRGEGDYAEPLGRLLRLLPGSGHAGNGNADGLPRDQQRRPYQWRECTGSRQHPHCGPWHDGPAPGDK